jgi:hypothetical protein
MKHDRLLFIAFTLLFPVLFYVAILEHKDLAAELAVIGFIGTISGLLIDIFCEA